MKKSIFCSAPVAKMLPCMEGRGKDSKKLRKLRTPFKFVWKKTKKSYFIFFIHIFSKSKKSFQRFFFFVIGGSLSPKFVYFYYFFSLKFIDVFAFTYFFCDLLLVIIPIFTSFFSFPTLVYNTTLFLKNIYSFASLVYFLSHTLITFCSYHIPLLLSVHNSQILFFDCFLPFFEVIPIPHFYKIYISFVRFYLLFDNIRIFQRLVQDLFHVSSSMSIRVIQRLKRCGPQARLLRAENPQQ